MKSPGETTADQLCAGDIDCIGETVRAFFEKNGEERKSALRLAFAAQEVLLNLKAHFGEAQEVIIKKSTRFGQVRCEIVVKGESFDPFSDAQEEVILRGLLSRMELAPTWRYRGGCNRIVFTRQKKQKLGTPALLAMAIAAGILLGQGLYVLAPQAGLFLSEVIFAPVFKALMGLVTTLASMLIFVSVINSICGIGDISTLSRVGGVMLTGFLKWMTLFAVAAAAIMLAFVPLSTGVGGDFDMTQVYQLFVDIVPTNLIEPLLTGNTMQLLSLAVIFGIGLLELGEKTDQLARILTQLELLVQHVTMGILRVLPFIVFMSIFRIFAGGKLAIILSSVRILLIFVLTSAICFLVNLLRVCLTAHVGIKKLLNKVMPTMLQGFATASSSAALFMNMETCEKRLGIHKTIVSFGVPLGQVVYMPGVICALAPIMCCIAQFYSIRITPMWLMTECVMAVLLAIAVPPIPGASALCYTVLMTRLGIPLEGLAIALALDAFIDPLSTGFNLGDLQLELVRTAKKLGMLDEKILRS